MASRGRLVRGRRLWSCSDKPHRDAAPPEKEVRETAGPAICSPRGDPMRSAATVAWVALLFADHGASAHERLDRFGDPLPAHAIARMGSLRFQSDQIIEHISFSSDGTSVLLAGPRGSRDLLFDSTSGKEVKLAVTSGLTGVGFAGQRTLGLALVPDMMGIWDCATGRKVRSIDFDRDLTGGTVAPDGSIAVLHYRDGADSRFRFLDMKTGNMTMPVRAAGVGQVDQYWFSADSRRLVMIGLTSDGQTFTAWELPAGRLLHNPAQGKHPLIFRGCFSADGTTICATGQP